MVIRQEQNMSVELQYLGTCMVTDPSLPDDVKPHFVAWNVDYGCTSMLRYQYKPDFFGISAYDPEKNFQRVRTIPLPLPDDDSGYREIAVHRNLVFVSQDRFNSLLQCVVHIVDLDHPGNPPIQVGVPTPQGNGITNFAPYGDRMFFAVHNTGSVGWIDLKSYTVDFTLPVDATVLGPFPNGMIIDPLIGIAYLPYAGSNTIFIAVVDVRPRIPVIQETIPLDLIIDAGYGLDASDRLLYVCDFAGGRLGLIDTLNNSVIGYQKPPGLPEHQVTLTSLAVDGLQHVLAMVNANQRKCLLYQARRH
jgi:hypothetical protein